MAFPSTLAPASAIDFFESAGSKSGFIRPIFRFLNHIDATNFRAVSKKFKEIVFKFGWGDGSSFAVHPDKWHAVFGNAISVRILMNAFKPSDNYYLQIKNLFLHRQDDSTIELPADSYQFLPLLEKLFMQLKGATLLHSIKALSLCPKLHSVDISYTDVTDEGLIALCTNRGDTLRSLKLHYCTSFGAAGLRAISACQSLTSLDLIGCNQEGIGDAAIAELANGPLIKTLQTLRMSACDQRQITIASLQSICKLTALNELQLFDGTDESFTPIVYEQLSALPALRTLDVSGLHQRLLTDATMLVISKLRNIRALVVRHQQPFEGATLQAIGTLPALEILQVWQSQIGEFFKHADDSHLDQWSKVREIRFARVGQIDQLAGFLRHMPSLETLLLYWVSDNALSNFEETLRGLCSLPRVRTIAIRWIKIESDENKAIAARIRQQFPNVILHCTKK